MVLVLQWLLENNQVLIVESIGNIVQSMVANGPLRRFEAYC
jgi:hypothetical protein